MSDLSVKIDVTNNPVRQLRDLGYQVRVNHYRYYINWDKVYEVMKKPSYNPIVLTFDLIANNNSIDLSLALPRGGKTIVTVVKPNGTELEGESICSMDDQFNKKMGVKKAIGRLLKFL